MTIDPHCVDDAQSLLRRKHSECGRQETGERDRQPAASKEGAAPRKAWLRVQSLIEALLLPEPQRPMSVTLFPSP